MNYLELIKNNSTGNELSFMSIATTGVGKDDEIIAVFVAKESGPIASMACSGIPADKLEITYKYHRITKQLYDNMIQVDREVMFRSMANFFNNDIMLSYNPTFVRKMVQNLSPARLEAPEIIDICKVCQWVRSGQIFNTIADATLGKMLLDMSGWLSSSTPGIKKTIQEVIPHYEEDLSKPAPEAMIEAMRCLCRFLEKQPVRISQG